MSFLAILQLIPAFFKFFDQITSLIKVLQGTPEEHHQKIMDQIEKEYQAFKDTGRPQW